MKTRNSRIMAAIFYLCFVSAVDAVETGASWEEAVKIVTGSVVTLEVDQPRAFGNGWNGSMNATGFVVDAERGIILTNRHVVTSAPVTARAIFQNYEDIDLIPLYRDPIHDFGFFRYNPELLKHNNPRSLVLNPDGVGVGVDIRVAGNDDGEKMSIVNGTLSRLDRPAPDYGDHSSDFNTFYIQASTGTTSGSSGSPVFNQAGEVVALNAGSSNRSSIAFFMPVDRAKRALTLLQAGKIVERGTVQTVFKFEPMDVLHDLGLSEGMENELRLKNGYVPANSCIAYSLCLQGYRRAL